MIIKNIEQKVKLAKLLSILSFAFSFAIVILMMMFLSKQLSESRKSIYILDKDIPILAKQTDESKTVRLSIRLMSMCSIVCFLHLHPTINTLNTK